MPRLYVYEMPFSQTSNHGVYDKSHFFGRLSNPENLLKRYKKSITSRDANTKSFTCDITIYLILVKRFNSRI
jgi:hypothetical protein